MTNHPSTILQQFQKQRQRHLAPKRFLIFKKNEGSMKQTNMSIFPSALPTESIQALDEVIMSEKCDIVETKWKKPWLPPPWKHQRLWSERPILVLSAHSVLLPPTTRGRKSTLEHLPWPIRRQQFSLFWEKREIWNGNKMERNGERIPIAPWPPVTKAILAWTRIFWRCMGLHV